MLEMKKNVCNTSLLDTKVINLYKRNDYYLWHRFTNHQKYLIEKV